MTCLWVLPFFPTSGRDNGYDVTNYYTVDPHLGSLEEFVAFVREAGERGIRVMMDLVMNHTSDPHPWFSGLLPGRRIPLSRLLRLDPHPASHAAG